MHVFRICWLSLCFGEIDDDEGDSTGNYEHVMKTVIWRTVGTILVTCGRKMFLYRHICPQRVIHTHCITRGSSILRPVVA